MYHSMLFPRQFYEYNQAGEPVYYSPYDGKVHKGYMFTDNGFWDTFRAQFPLNLLLHPEMHGRYLKSLLDAYDQSGWLPSWSCPGHSGGMIGNHAFSLLADAWVKGVRTFDPQQALKAMYHDATDKAPFRTVDRAVGMERLLPQRICPFRYHQRADSQNPGVCL